MMWRLLFGLIYVHHAFSFAECHPNKRKSTSTSATEIREKRVVIEKQHYEHYLNNEVAYRNWPEVRENPKRDCLRFLQKIFPRKAHLALATPAVHNVILNYRHIRDENNDMVTKKRVTALECRLPSPSWSRKFMYFVRSPQSPKCAIALNRMRKKSLNFYVVEDICEDQNYLSIRKFFEELEEDKLVANASISKRGRRKELLLPDEEVKIKRAEFEKRHYEYCASNPELCKLWPEVQPISENECQRFFRRMLPKSPNLLLIPATHHQVTLEYLETKDEHNRRLNAVVLEAIECKLPQSVEGRHYVFLIRAPSYPSCVFYILRKILLTEFFYIVEEICDTPSHNISLHTLFLKNEKDSKHTKRIQLHGYEPFEKLKEYEELHFQDYSIRQYEYEEWPDLEQTNIRTYCQTTIANIFPQIADTSDIDKLVAKLQSVELKYSTLNSFSGEIIPITKVKALQCFIPEEPPSNLFQFIRAPKPSCVYWIKRRYRKQNFFFIAREYCNDDARFTNF